MGMSSTLRERIHMRKMTITNALIFIRQLLYFGLVWLKLIINPPSTLSFLGYPSVLQHHIEFSSYMIFFDR